MSPWKLIVEQVESGYATYRVWLIWQHTQSCPHPLRVTEYGKGLGLRDDFQSTLEAAALGKDIDAITWFTKVYPKWFGSVADADKQATKFKQQWHKKYPSF